MREVIMIFGAGLVTFLERYPMMALTGRMKLPARVSQALKFVPPAVLAAIIVPDVLLSQNGVSGLNPANARLIAAVVASLVIWRTKNLLLTIVVGMVVMLGWQALVH